MQVRHSIKFCMPSPLASVDWHKVTSTQDGGGAADEILDILLALPTYLSASSSQFMEFNAVTGHGITTLAEKTRLVNLLEHFNQYESRHLRECDESPSLPENSDAGKPRLSDANKHKTQLHGNGAGDFCSFDIQTMLDSAMVIIAYLILSQHDAWSSAEQISFLDEQDRRSASILRNADRTLKENPKGLNPGACLQFVFPLEVVATFSCDAVKRDDAQQVLDRIGWARL